MNICRKSSVSHSSSSEQQVLKQIFCKEAQSKTSVNMARFLALSILVIIPAVLSAPTDTEKDSAEKSGRSLALPLPVGSASSAAGGIGGQYTQNEGSQETHNDKNLGFTYGSKQGSSSNFKNTGAQAGAYGAQADVQQPYGYGGYAPAPYAPVYPGYQYPGYHTGYYPGVGLGAVAGVPGAGAAAGLAPGYGGALAGVPGAGAAAGFAPGYGGALAGVPGAGAAAGLAPGYGGALAGVSPYSRYY